MAGFDTKEMMNRAIRYMAQTAMDRAAGGWVSPKERERQQRDAMRQEQQQARQAEKQHKEATRAHEKEQKLLSKQFPTQYMPNVGRQVMQDGGVPEDVNKVGLYSKAARTVAALPQKKATGAQMVAALRDPKRGVKKEELINAGLMLPSEEVHPDWANRSVTTDELAKHFKDQQPQIEEKVLGRQPTGYGHKTSDEWNEAVAQAEIAGNWDEANRLQEAWEKSEAAPTKYHEWTLPGGENYREVLLKLPHEKKQRVGVTSTGEIFTEEELSNPTVRNTAEKIGLTMEDRMIPTTKPFLSQHWGEHPNVLAHIRMADRTGPNGEKILHVEELQSDWGQKGREEGFGVPPEEEALWQKTEKRMKEIRSREAQIIADELEGKPVDKRELQQLYIERQRLTPVYSALELKRDTAVPHGPYVTSTEGWTDLALKRVLKEAAEGGYDKIVFTPGEEQAKRYNLSAHVDRLAYDPEEKTLSYWKKGANAWTDHPEDVEPNKLHKVIGKDAAKQLLATEPNKLSGIHSMDTKDLVIGEEGMKAYYNQIVPSRLQDLVKKHDPNARVGVSQIGNIVPKNTELEQFSQSINFEQPAQPKAPIQFTGASLDVTPQMRESVMKGQEAYAHGGEVDGYANGGSPSLSQRILDYAETLPTAEENIETIKKFGRNVGEGAADIGKRVFSGFEKMAERALDRSPPPTVRAGERPVYVEPKREEPPQRLYVLPDGRRVSGAELEMHNEMMRERWDEQHAMPPVVQEGMPSPNRPAPTRAPMREKLQRQEQQENVNRPVVLPEREGFKWPQVYKDIMSPEPQMEWTKGMTPREQPAPAPVQTAEGSIFSSRGSDGRESGIQMGGGSNASGPLEVNVTKTIVEPKYEDVYLGTGDTPNPFHSAQTMVAPAPEYEGQVVPIPDTPADRMGEYHLSKLIWPLHDLKYKKGYKAKQGLEDYNPPMSATGERFPNQEDVNFYRDVDAYYGRPEAGYLQQGARGSYYDDLTKMVDRQGGYRRTMTPQESDAFNAAYIAAQRNPIAALGFRPEEFDFSGDPIPQTTAGSVLGPSSRIYADLKFPSVAVHEAIHRGLMEIWNEDYNAYLAKTDNLLKEMNDLTKQRYSPEMQNRIFQISNELDRLHENKTDPDIFPPGQVGDPEGKVDEQELFVRSLMYKMFGPVEAYEMERQLVNGDVIKEYPQEKLERFMSDNADRIARLEQRAMKMLQERQRAAGPRASGGKVERQGLASGGSPDNDMIRDALSRVASPFSDNPELAAKAVEIANQAYKVPTGNITAGPSYYGFKGPMDVSDIQTTVEPLPDVSPAEKNPMSWEDFYKVGKGGTMINLGGDRSRLGRLTHINGQELAWPVDLHAGPEYMLEPNPGAVWANAPGHTSGLRNKILQAAEKGPVYGVYTPMGPKTVDSSFQMFDALLSQIAANPPSKKVAKQLDDSLKQAKFVMGSTDKAVKDREKEKDRMENWPGILNALEAREHAKNLPGSTRSLIVKYLDRAAWHKLGLPHIGMTRAAITSPDLIGAPANMMGHRIVELSPEEVEETAFKHNTYKSPTGGKYVGDVPLVQRQYAMPDVMDQFLARRVGSKGDVIMHPYSLQSGGRDAARKMLEEQKQMQPVSQRMLDSIQQGLERQSKYGLKDGGKVEDREQYAIGGNPGDMATGGYGTGISGVTGSVDRNVAAGGTESNFSGGNDSGGYSGYGGDGGRDYGGGGRDSSPSIDRSIGGDGGRDFSIGGPQGLTGAPAFGRPEQGTDTYNLDNQPPMTVGARFSPNIGADFVKEVITPDFGSSASRPARPITPTPFSGYPQEVQNALNPVKPDSAFGQTLIDPTGKYTNQALDQMGVATDALTMLNSPTLAGAFVRAFTPTPTPATAQQQAAIERMYRRDLNTGVPANFATPEGMAQRYGAPGATPLARPGQTSTAYLSAGPSASTGRQDMPIGSTSVAPSQSANQTPRENFEQAFAAARARGEQTFSWTNPATGQTTLYTTQLGRKQGGRVPSLKEPEQWECKEKR